MADVQTENGYTVIANVLLEHLAGYRLSGQEWQVLLVIIRKTWGWHQKEEVIPLAQFVQATKMAKSSCIRAVKKLLDKNIIYKKVNGDIAVYGINKNFDSWEEPISRSVYKKVNERLQKSKRSVYKKVNERLQKSKRLEPENTDKNKPVKTSKYNINIYKKNNKEKITFDGKNFTGITDGDKQLWATAYRCNVEQELAKMTAWLIANPARRKRNYRAFIVRWLARVSQQNNNKNAAHVSASRGSGKIRVKIYKNGT